MIPRENLDYDPLEHVYEGAFTAKVESCTFDLVTDPLSPLYYFGPEEAEGSGDPVICCMARADRIAPFAVIELLGDNTFKIHVNERLWGFIPELMRLQGSQYVSFDTVKDTLLLIYNKKWPE